MCISRCADVCATRACPLSASPLPDSAACSPSGFSEGCTGEREGGGPASDGVMVVVLEKCVTPSSLRLDVCACLCSHSGAAVARVHRRAAHKTVGPASLLPPSGRSNIGQRRARPRRWTTALLHSRRGQKRRAPRWPVLEPFLSPHCRRHLISSTRPSPCCARGLLASRPRTTPTLFS